MVIVVVVSPTVVAVVAMFPSISISMISIKTMIVEIVLNVYIIMTKIAAMSVVCEGWRGPNQSGKNHSEARYRRQSNDLFHCCVSLFSYLRVRALSH